MKKGIFVTATGTDVGKTYVSALLVKKLRETGVNAGYFKPALSGAYLKKGRLIPGDSEEVCRIAGLPDAPEDLTGYLFEAAVSPHLAAQLEGRMIEEQVILDRYEQICSRYDFVVVEGCGGIFCPLRLGESPFILPDLIRLLELDALIVSTAGLGSINAAVLTAAYARMAGIGIQGILLNRFEEGNPLHEDNLIQIERFAEVPVLSCIPENAGKLEINLGWL